MPQMGVSVSEGTITKWLEAVGDTVEADETLLEISTDKVDTEVPSPAPAWSRRSSSRRARPSRSAPCSRGSAARPGARRAERCARARRRSPRRSPQPRPSQPRRPRSAEQPPAPAASPQPAQPARPGNGKLVRLAGRRADRGRARHRPVAGPGHRPRRPRHEEGHPGVRRVGRRRRQRPRAAGSRAARLPRPGQPRRRLLRRRAAPAPAACGAGARAPPPQPEPQAPGETLEPMTAMRRGIAEHMRRSLDTSAHVTSAIEVDMSKVVADPREAEEGVPGGLRRQPDVPRVHRARDGRDAARLPVGERRAPRRPDRDAQLRQPRLRGRARGRQGPDRPGPEERRDAQPARHGEGRSPTSPSARATRS